MARPSCLHSHAAHFSRCGRYRWWLKRQWREGPTLLFIGLNPSSADGRRDDPTLRRLIGFADSWGYGALEVVNLFAWISADPAELRQAAEPLGRRCDIWIRSRLRQLQSSNLRQLHHRAERQASPMQQQPDSHDDLPVWLGWGNGGAWRGRDQQMLQLLSRWPAQLLCLGHTASGQPRHPLYVPSGSPLLPFGASWVQLCASSTDPCPAPRAATRSI